MSFDPIAAKWREHLVCRIKPWFGMNEYWDVYAFPNRPDAIFIRNGGFWMEEVDWREFGRAMRWGHLKLWTRQAVLVARDAALQGRAICETIENEPTWPEEA